MLPPDEGITSTLCHRDSVRCAVRSNEARDAWIAPGEAGDRACERLRRHLVGRVEGA